MPHLKVIRKGWENEHLARYLLAKIAYVSAPVFIGDDIGMDLICTLFEPRITKSDRKQIELFPQYAFALQLKSSDEAIEFSANNAEYFGHLAMPFFVGIADQAPDNPSLSIYSGELIPAFSRSEPRGFPIRLLPSRNPLGQDAMAHWSKSSDGSYEIPLPFVTQLSFRDDADAILTARVALRWRCEYILKNIAAAISDEYIFHYPSKQGGFYRILAVPGSAHTFRGNFARRLSEAFYNLAYLAEIGTPENLGEEFMIYERCYSDLKAINAVDEYSVEMLERLYQHCRRTLADRNYHKTGPDDFGGRKSE